MPDIEAIRKTLELKYCSLDAYMLPGGEKRVGMEGASFALGFAERWLYNRLKRPSKWLEGLYEKGFNGAQIEVEVKGTTRGSAVARTISIRDFNTLVGHEAIENRNSKAVILLFSFSEGGMQNTFDGLFNGHSMDELLARIVHYSEWTYEELEEVLAYNREDVRALNFWGN